MQNFQQAIEWLYAQAPMFQSVGARAFNKSLNKTNKLDELLGKPHASYPCIHIAGTNGKGSTAHMLAAILQTAGYKVGLYTSPHLKQFTERIKCNGEEIKQEYVLDFITTNKTLIEKVSPSFFEITTLMAFSYFEYKKIDVAVIETGMGGRLDSTNIITPILSIITSIGKDHQQYLGNNIEQIAAEKAGIIKPKVPLVFGNQPKKVVKVLKKTALEKDAPYTEVKRKLALHDFQLQPEGCMWRFKQVSTRSDRNLTLLNYTTDLKGFYQAQNLALVLTSVPILQQIGYKINEEHLSTALANTCQITNFKGRWQLIQSQPKIIVDIGHNEDAVAINVKSLKLEKAKKLHIVWGMSSDKKIDDILKLLPSKATYYFTQAQGKRAMDAKLLAEQAAHYRLHGNVYPDVDSAYKSAKNELKEGELLFVGGSAFVVAEVPDL